MPYKLDFPFPLPHKLKQFIFSAIDMFPKQRAFTTAYSFPTSFRIVLMKELKFTE